MINNPKNYVVTIPCTRTSEYKHKKNLFSKEETIKNKYESTENVYIMGTDEDTIETIVERAIKTLHPNTDKNTVYLTEKAYISSTIS